MIDIFGMYIAQHKDWRGIVYLNKDGTFLGGESKPNGTYVFNDNVLTLNWNSWEPETANKVLDNFYGNTFSLIKESETTTDTITKINVTFKNLKTNSRPIVVHAPGLAKNSLKFSRLYPYCSEIKSDPRVMIATCGDKRGYFLEKQLQANNIEYLFYPLTGKYNSHPWLQKLHELRDVVSQITTDYVLYIDSMDSYVSGDISTLVDYFIKEDLDAFFGSEKTCHITDPESEVFELEKYGCHLNSGLYIAKTKWLKETLKKLNEPVNDQLFLKMIHRLEYPKVQIDKDSMFFFNLYSTKANAEPDNNLQIDMGI